MMAAHKYISDHYAGLHSVESVVVMADVIRSVVQSFENHFMCILFDLDPANVHKLTRQLSNSIEEIEKEIWNKIVEYEQKLYMR